ncbi:MAG TPA: PIG-L family deacetylase [Thermoplasmatales archaeon]|uniref:LmbE family protein n=1 Tax=Candidatus Syntropharchaeum caldarium TaxID=1838285 RepID=A0A1F2P8Y8_9EURY|nr:MAG: LmbE family protein [Candidatus Syntrophoarchaeum caldarius]HEC77314.1 PIG-L family deacetylase [Thermoplasmatales archaeon]
MKILILSPHTDDAELGCGGSIIKFIEERHKILWIVFSAAEESLPKNLPKDTLKKEFLRVVESLGLKEKNYRIYNFKVRYLDDHRQEILENLIRIREEFKPKVVFGPSLNDFHQDHQVVANEMIRAFKTMSSIICYELPWNHVTFNTQLFVKLKKEHIIKKCEMLKNYKSQLAKEKAYFSEEFIQGLAKTRGIQCNSECAEAFEVIRWMV